MYNYETKDALVGIQKVVEQLFNPLTYEEYEDRFILKNTKLNDEARQSGLIQEEIQRK